MSYQITKVDLIPNGEIVKCNASQFDNGRVLPFEIYENKVAYNIPNDVRVELHCRKPDENIVTLPSFDIVDNIVTFITTTQLTACYGDNVCEIALYGADDYLIGSANFILEVEKSPTYGGINSTSSIHNLESQIRGIAEDVIPEILPDYLGNYYTKSEVDALIDNIFPIFISSGAIASFITALTKPLVSVTAAENATMITRCGINLWDEEIRNGYYNNTGVFYVYATSISNKNPIKVKPNTTYYAHVSANYQFFVFTYDSEGNFISRITTAKNNTFITPPNCAYINWCNGYGEGGTYENNVSINSDSTNTTYHAYNGQTVQVSDATTLVTLSGVNNVFADVGDVTVRYKYMSMPETQTNSNRLALSPVRSDIIKEKSEIEEQSDIIEDIERGEKDE